MLPLFFFVLPLFGRMISAQEQRRLNFTINEVLQCEPVSIRFSPGTEEAIPLMVLTIFPFESTPMVFSIRSVALNSTVIKLASLPLQAGEHLIASLNDEAGRPLAALSEVITVMPSPTGNKTCLENSPPSLSLGGGHFNLISAPSQCEDVAVAYDTDAAPILRVLMPNGDSFTMPRTSDDHNGTARYLVNMKFGFQVLFLFDDGLDHRETTNLMTVSGGSTSRNDCLPEPPVTSKAAQPVGLPSTNSEQIRIPQSLTIGISVGAAVTLIIIILLVIFIWRDRKHRRQGIIGGFASRSSFGNIRPSSDSDSLGTDTFEKFSSTERAIDNDSKEGSSLDPSYVRNAEKIKVDDRPTSTSSWLYDDSWGVRDTPTYRRPSINSLLVSDIEGMLNMAATLSRPQMCKQATRRHAAVLPAYPSENSRSVAVCGVPEGRGYPTRYWREPPDVPADSTASDTHSSYSFSVPSQYSGDQSLDLPSPFIREDEHVRAAFDIAYPETIRAKEIAYR